MRPLGPGALGPGRDRRSDERGLGQEGGDRGELGHVVSATGQIEVGSAAPSLAEIGAPLLARRRAEVAQVDRVKHRSLLPAPDGGFGPGLAGKIWEGEMTRYPSWSLSPNRVI